MSNPLPSPLRLLLFFILNFFASAQDGKIAQFLTDLCGRPSVINPIVTLPLDTCLVTQGAQSLVVQLRPECNSGNKATLILYEDTLCAAIDPITWTSNSTCIAYSPSAGVPAVMFACDAHAGSQPQATSTSTVAAGSPTTPPVAETTLPSGDSAGTSASLTSAGVIESATPSSSAPPASSQTSSSSPSENSNSSLSRNDQIALGVVLPLGTIAVALLAWLWPKPWKKNKEEGKSESRDKFSGQILRDGVIQGPTE